MGLIDDIDLTDKEEGHDPGRPDALSCGVRRSRGHKMGDLRRYHSCREPVRSCRTNVRGVFLVVTVQALWNVGTDFVLVPFAVISYALGDEAGAHEAIAA